MIEYAKDNQTQTKTVKAVICPKCFKSLPGSSIIGPKIDRYDRMVRIYFGWCIHCRVGCEVVQFYKDQLWHINKYRLYGVVAKQVHCKPIGEWTTVNQLPQPAAVVTGPGGQYDKQIDLNTAYFNLLRALQNALKSTTVILEQLLKTIKND